MQKNLKYFFVHYLQKQFHPLNTSLQGKLHQHPPGTPSPQGCRAGIHLPTAGPVVYQKLLIA
jgi:hypothetical protein